MTHIRALSLILAAVMVIALDSAAPAQIVRPDDTDAYPLGVTLSGGVSLGSYQAGVNWAVLEGYRREVGSDVNSSQHGVLGPHRLAVVTGASAGTINTLIWGTEACTDTQGRARPESSLFWQVWTRIGLNVLLAAPGKGDLALFDRGFVDDMILKLMHERWNDSRLMDGCEIPAAIALTRMVPGQLSLAGSLGKQQIEAKTQRYATGFVMRVEDGRLKFYTPPWSELGSLQRFGKLISLPATSSSSRQIPDSLVIKAIEASSAFPWAFEPVYLPYRDVSRDNGRLEVKATYCPDVAAFLDGGAFDNNPLGLALHLHHAYTRRDSLSEASDTIRVLYVNPGRRRPTAQPRLQETHLSPGLIGTAVSFLDGFVTTARQYELQALARDEALADQLPFELLPPTRYAPIFGTHLGAFGAFVAQEFREYDFYVGVYDGLSYIAEQLAAADARTSARTYLGQLIQQDEIALGPTGRAVAAMLFKVEHGEELLMDAPPTRSDSLRIEMFRAFQVALMRGTARGDVKCVNMPLGERLLCEDGLLAILTELKASPAVDAARRESVTACVRARGDIPCDSSLMRILEDPSGFADEMIERLITRIPDVERRARIKRRVAEYQGCDPIVTMGESRTPERLGEVLHWGYRMSAARRPLLDLDPSTIPDGAHLLHVAPYQVGINLGASGYEIGWRPTLNLSQNVRIGLPAALHYNPHVLASQCETAMFGGTGAVLSGDVQQWLFLISSVGIGALHWWGPSRCTDLWAYEAELTLFGGMLQVVARRPRETGYLHGDARLGWMVRVSDLNGLLYWLSRLAF